MASSGSGSGLGPPEIQPQEIEKYFVLGDGSFGTVFQVWGERERESCRSRDDPERERERERDLDEENGGENREGEVAIVSNRMGNTDRLSKEKEAIPQSELSVMCREDAVGKTWQSKCCTNKTWIPQHSMLFARYKHTQGETYSQREREREREGEGERERERDRQTDRQTDTHTHTHTHRDILRCTCLFRKWRL
jgi:hypothetical protein